MTLAELRARCVQRCNRMPLSEPVAESLISAWLRRFGDWVIPPLDYGAPVRVDLAAQMEAARAHQTALTRGLDGASGTQLSGDIRAALLQQAREGYQLQDARVASIEARAGAFEGYAAAAAGIGVLGAAVLGGRGDFTLCTLYGVALVVVVAVAAFCLVLSGHRAYQASAKRFDWPRPNDPPQIVMRITESNADLAELEMGSLGALLAATCRGELLADWKLDRFRHAALFFSLALTLLIVGALLLVLAT